MSYSFGTNYESLDLAKRGIEDFQIKNVLSIVCPRQQNNTKDSGNFRLYNVFCIHY